MKKAAQDTHSEHWSLVHDESGVLVLKGDLSRLAEPYRKNRFSRVRIFLDKLLAATGERRRLRCEKSEEWCLEIVEPHHCEALLRWSAENNNELHAELTRLAQPAKTQPPAESPPPVAAEPEPLQQAEMFLGETLGTNPNKLPPKPPSEKRQPPRSLLLNLKMREGGNAR